MNILHLSSEKSWRGGEQQIAYLIEESEKQGHQIYVACQKNSAFEKYCLKNGLNFITLNFRNQFNFFAAHKLKSFCKYMCIDVVHAHSSHSHALMVWSGLLGNNAEQIVSRRVDFEVSNNFLSKFKYNYSKIKSIICVSKAIQEMVQKVLKDKNKAIVIHSGIDLNKFNQLNNNKLKTEYNLKSDCVLIGNVAALAPHKDYDTFINTAEEILTHTNKNIHFFIIGDGNLHDELVQKVKNKKLENKITFTGFRNDVAKILPELDVFLFTSKTEGLGTSLLDAMACKVAVSSTYAGGIPEIIQHNENGLLAPVGDYKQLAKNTLELINNNELRIKLVEKATETLTAFKKENTAQKNIEVYLKP